MCTWWVKALRERPKQRKMKQRDYPKDVGERKGIPSLCEGTVHVLGRKE